MKKIANKLNENKGAVTTIVTVTLMFFIIVLSSAFAIMANVRKTQIKNQLVIKELYQNEVNSAPQIEQNLGKTTKKC